jgi:hypothetical protein
LFFGQRRTSLHNADETNPTTCDAVGAWQQIALISPPSLGMSVHATTYGAVVKTSLTPELTATEMTNDLWVQHDGMPPTSPYLSVTF